MMQKKMAYRLLSISPAVLRNEPPETRRSGGLREQIGARQQHRDTQVRDLDRNDNRKEART